MAPWLGVLTISMPSATCSVCWRHHPAVFLAGLGFVDPDFGRQAEDARVVTNHGLHAGQEFPGALVVVGGVLGEVFPAAPSGDVELGRPAFLRHGVEQMAELVAGDADGRSVRFLESHPVKQRRDAVFDPGAEAIRDLAVGNPFDHAADRRRITELMLEDDKERLAVGCPRLPVENRKVRRQYRLEPHAKSAQGP